MISIRNLSKYYQIKDQQIPALKDIDLDVQPKEIFGIIGRSGAGKSTLIRCVNMLEKPSEGNIFIGGTCITAMKPSELRAARRQMGMIFQHFNLLHSRNVIDNIALPLELVGMSPAQIKSRVDELLALVELQPHAKKYPRQLSGGQKQRVAIARALANSPKILLCDEATSSLDPQSTLAILNLLHSIHQELGITILLITHEMEVVKTLCHRVAVISHGTIVEQSSTVELFTQPKTKIAKRLVNASLRMELPDNLKKMINQAAESGTILRIAYQGEITSQPLIAELIQRFHLMVNILLGNIENIQDQIVGVMIVQVKGEQIQNGIAFLEESGLHVEVLSHV